MAELSGSVGAIYKSLAFNKSTGISFDKTASPDTILDSNSGFTVAKGFGDGIAITVYGSTSNDGDYTVITRTGDGTLTMGEAVLVQDEAAGDTVYVYTTRPGTLLAGFFNWTLDNGIEMLDVTDFSDGGYRSFITGLKAWTATAEKHYFTTDLLDNNVGTVYWVRFFIRYDAAPNVTPAYFYEGPATLSGFSTTTPVDGIVTQTINFQGNGPLRLQTQDVAWP